MSQEIVAACRMSSFVGSGHLPGAGSLMDQSAWFLSLHQTLESDVAEIERERMERAKRVRR